MTEQVNIDFERVDALLRAAEDAICDARDAIKAARCRQIANRLIDSGPGWKRAFARSWLDENPEDVEHSQ
jgi:hypothetical protein